MDEDNLLEFGVFAEVNGEKLSGNIVMESVSGDIKLELYAKSQVRYHSGDKPPAYVQSPIYKLTFYLFEGYLVSSKQSKDGEMSVITFKASRVFMANSREVANAPINVRKATLSYDRMVRWFDLSEYIFSVDDEISWVPKATQTVTTQHGDALTIKPVRKLPFQARNNMGTITIQQENSLEFVYSTPKSMVDVIDDYKWLMSLFHIFTQENPEWNSISIETDVMQADGTEQKGLLMMARAVDSLKTESMAVYLYPFRTLTQSVGEDFSALTRWFEVRDKIEVPVELYISSALYGKQLLKVVFLLAVQGLECLHRNCFWSGKHASDPAYKEYVALQANRFDGQLKSLYTKHLLERPDGKGKGNITLADRIYDLLTYDGYESPFWCFDGQGDTYKAALLLANTRNYYSHYYTEDQNRLDGQDLYVGACLCQTLLLSHILRQSGVDKVMIKEWTRVQMNYLDYDGFRNWHK